MTESRFKCAAVTLLRQRLRGAWIYHPSDRWNSGVPDLLILWRGVFAAIELKVGRNKPTKLQLVTLDKICTAGGIIAVCYNLEEIKHVVGKMEMRAADKGRELWQG